MSGPVRVVLRLIAVVLPAALVAGLAGWAALHGAWARLGVPTMHPSFMDLRQLTSTAWCAREIPGWSWTSPTCDPRGRSFNYPVVWARIFGWLGVSESSTETIGLGLIALFVCVVLALTVLLGRGGRHAVGVVLLTAAALSPPARLALERGNIDLMVLALVVLAVVLSLSRIGLLAAPVLAFATHLKLFPIGAALLLMVRTSDRRLRIGVFVLGALIALGALAPQLGSIATGTPQSFRTSYGVSVVPLLSRAWGVPWAAEHAREVGLLVLATTSALGVLLTNPWSVRRRGRWVTACARVSHDRVAATLVLAGNGTFLASYCVGTSFDYRLVFLLPTITGLLRVARGSTILMVTAWVTVVMLYLSYPLGAAQPLGDLLWLIVAPALAVMSATILVHQGPFREVRWGRGADGSTRQGDSPSASTRAGGPPVLRR